MKKSKDDGANLLKATMRNLLVSMPEWFCNMAFTSCTMPTTLLVYCSDLSGHEGK